MADERLHALGKLIWKRVVRIVALEGLAGASDQVVAVDAGEEEQRELRKLHGDLQTLFRGGVFPEDITAEQVMEDLRRAHVIDDRGKPYAGMHEYVTGIPADPPQSEKPYCPCGGQCHHLANPCSLSCIDGESRRVKPWVKA